MSEFERSLDFVNDIIRTNEQLLSMQQSLDKRLQKANEEIETCDNLLFDTYHMAELIDDKMTTDEEYALIGRRVSELRKRRRDAKKTKYVLEQNRKVVKGLLPALETADTQFIEPSIHGNPTYYMYRLRDDETNELIDALPSLDRKTPIEIVNKRDDVTIPEGVELETEEPETCFEEQESPLPSKRPLNVVRVVNKDYVIQHDGEVVHKSKSFVGLILYLTNELECSETQFVSKAYKTLVTFAKTYCAQRGRGTDDIDPLLFERLASNSFCG